MPRDSAAPSRTRCTERTDTRENGIVHGNFATLLTRLVAALACIFGLHILVRVVPRRIGWARAGRTARAAASGCTQAACADGGGASSRHGDRVRVCSWGGPVCAVGTGATVRTQRVAYTATLLSGCLLGRLWEPCAVPREHAEKMRHVFRKNVDFTCQDVQQWQVAASKRHQLGSY